MGSLDFSRQLSLPDSLTRRSLPATGFNSFLSFSSLDYQYLQ